MDAQARLHSYVFHLVPSVMFFFSFFFFCSPADALNYKVGDRAGWTIPAVGEVNYTTWAERLSCFVGDTLVFVYDARLHDVVVVSQHDYDACNASTPEGRYDSGKTRIALNGSGMWFFICSVPGHCQAGQKLAIEVFSVPPSPSPSPYNRPYAAPTPSIVPTLNPAPTVSPGPRHSLTFAPTPSPHARHFFSSVPAPPSSMSSRSSRRVPTTHAVSQAMPRPKPSHRSFLLSTVLVGVVLTKCC